MDMYVDHEAGDKLRLAEDDDEIPAGLALVVRANGRMEVWADDCETHYGNLPAGFPVGQLAAVMSFYRAGEKQGFNHGRATVQAQLRNLIGIVD